MGIIRNIKRDRQKLQQERKQFFKDIMSQRQEIQKERQKTLKTFAENRPDRNIEFSPTVGFGGCPIFSRNQQLELQARDFDNNNIWGVRGIITIFIVMTFCLICMVSFILPVFPLSWKFELLKYFFVIVTLVIGAYFYTRLKLPFRL